MRGRAALPALALLLVGAALLITRAGSTASLRLVDAPQHLLPVDWHHGFNLTDYTAGGYATPQATVQLRRMAATGVRDAVFVPVLYQDSANASAVTADPQRSATPAALLLAMRTARGLGLQSVVKPHLDVLDGSFRGLIAPADRAAWFASYRQELLRYARVAQLGGATVFVVGTELTGVQDDTAAWRALIADVRAVFRGRLTYAANWSPGPDAVSFWDALDYVGVDAYWPLAADGGQPSVAALQRAWRPWVRSLIAVARRVGRPALLTEIGYPARQASTLNPSAEDSGAAVDPLAQQAAYAAAYAVWREVPQLAGMWWWEWATDERNATLTGGYPPAGKPAESVVRRYAAGT